MARSGYSFTADGAALVANAFPPRRDSAREPRWTITFGAWR